MNSHTILPMEQNDLLLAAVLEEAKKRFVNGYKTNEKFKAKIEIDSELKAKTHCASKFPQYKDALYPDYNMNRIKDTLFVASAGPKTAIEASAFVYQTLLHPKAPTHHIVALGAELGYRPTDPKDFYEYCYKSSQRLFHDLFMNVERVRGDALYTEYGTYKPTSVIESNLTIVGRKDLKPLYVTLFPLEDNAPLNFQKHPDLKDRLLEWFERTKDQTVVVHCAGGIGRTGHFILMMTLFKHYKDIFASQNPVQIAEKIHAWLDTIREHRPALVATLPQFLKAIENAHVLYQYKLEKTLKENLHPAIVSPISMFKQTAEATINMHHSYSETITNTNLNEDYLPSPRQ